MEHCCPWWLTPLFDNWIRRKLQPPGPVVEPFVRPGMRVADLGCGMGYFTAALAERVGPGGRVFAVDLQREQLDVVRRRVDRAGVGPRVTTVQADATALKLDEPVDFALLFWMLHEVPDRSRLLSELKRQMNPGGKALVAEPVIHVGAGDFRRELDDARACGFAVEDAPRLTGSHVAVLAARERG